MTNIILKKGKESSLQRFHRWVFSGAIASFDGDKPEDGDIVTVKSSKGEFLARGFCGVGSIAVRILTFVDEQIDEQWWCDAIERAYNLRKVGVATLTKETNCYRLIHGEGDCLPGLVVDIYDRVAVMQAHCAGVYFNREVIAAAIMRVMGSEIDAVYDKSSGTVPASCEIDVKDGFIGVAGLDQSVVLENGLKFNINWREGQKTGFFIDQRDNRALVGTFAKGRNVLNTFCYTGGFSVYAAAAGAKSVVSIDSSAKAIDLANQNIELNFGDTFSHEGIATDAIEYLKTIEKDQLDMIILDPPAFAKHQKAQANALQAYKRINTHALRNIAKGGVLFTFSCSQAISKEQFRNAVFSAAAIAGRNVRIIHFLTQPFDHPINIYHPEGEYLKGLALYVE